MLVCLVSKGGITATTETVCISVPGTGGVAGRPIDLVPVADLAEMFPPAGETELPTTTTDRPHLLDGSSHQAVGGGLTLQPVVRQSDVALSAAHTPPLFKVEAGENSAAGRVQLGQDLDGRHLSWSNTIRASPVTVLSFLNFNIALIGSFGQCNYFVRYNYFYIVINILYTYI